MIGISWCDYIWLGYKINIQYKDCLPELDTKDYYEIGKMCLDDKLPRNSESQLLSSTRSWLKENTKIKYLFTWADGLVGKPSYVYQSKLLIRWFSFIRYICF